MIKLRTQLALSYFMLLILPFSVLFYAFFQVSSSAIMNIAQNNLLSLANKTSQIIDRELNGIIDSSRVLTADPTLYRIFQRSNYAPYELNSNDKNVRAILNQYYPRAGGDFTLSIITPQYVYGEGIFASGEAFLSSPLHQIAKDGGGKLCWIAHNALKDILPQSELEAMNLTNYYQFAAVSQIAPIEVDYLSGTAFLPESPVQDQFRPVLLINFSDLFLNRFLEGVNNMAGGIYCLSDIQGHIVDHTDPALWMNREELPWLEKARQEPSGIVVDAYLGRRMVCCYAVSEITGWVTAFAVPVDVLMGNVGVMRTIILLSAVVLMLITLAMAYIISRRVTGPISRLVSQVRRFGEGDFKGRLPIARSDEMGQLTAGFNEMGEKIEQLIHENYIVKLREKETEIEVLNQQLNPHFLYNALNIVNLEALECNQPRISKMVIALSRMLQYTVACDSEMAKLCEDISWIHSYIYIMRLRFDKAFEIQLDIAEELLPVLVPRLFLLPPLENAIVHGMRGIHENGLIRITGSKRGEGMVFVVSDNGNGISPDRLQAVRDGQGGFGLRSVQRRLQLIYGPEYGLTLESEQGKGTQVTILLSDRG